VEESFQFGIHLLPFERVYRMPQTPSFVIPYSDPNTSQIPIRAQLTEITFYPKAAFMQD
jgi:hypothetical protein